MNLTNVTPHMAIEEAHKYFYRGTHDYFLFINWDGQKIRLTPYENGVRIDHATHGTAANDYWEMETVDTLPYPLNYSEVLKERDKIANISLNKMAKHPTISVFVGTRPEQTLKDAVRFS